MRVSLSRKINILLFLMACMAVLNLPAAHYYLSLQRHDSTIINLAGRQRMLTQEISKLALLSNAGDKKIVRAQLAEAVRRYDDTLRALYKGGSVEGAGGKANGGMMKIPPAPPGMNALFEENLALWRPFKEHAMSISEGRHDGGATAAVVRDNMALLNASNAITGEFDARTGKKEGRARALLLLMTLIDLAIFIVGGYKVLQLVNPLTGLAKSAMELGMGNFSLRIPLPESDDEIRDLAAAFNDMTENLQNSVISREYMDGLINTMGEMLFVIGPDGVIETENHAVSEVLGYERDELHGKPFLTVFAEGEEAALRESLVTVRSKGALKNVEGRFKTRDGGLIAVQCSFSLMMQGGGGDVVCLATDITVRKHYEGELRKLSMAVEQSLSSIVITDVNGNIEFVNQKFTEGTGYTLSEVKGKNPRILKSGRHGPEFYKELWDTITAGKEFRADMCNRKKDGTLYWELLSITPIKDIKGVTTHYIAVKLDDTERKRAEERMKQLAHYDVLTGIPNRTLFEDRLKHTVQLAGRGGFSFAIVFLDLDGFKYVNDTLGHHVGDLLLKEVAARITACVRKSDTVARMGGDEFQVILSRITEPSDAANIVRKIISEVNEPFTIGEHKSSVGVSAGISIFPSDGENTQTLIKNADMAMYKVKEQGKNDFMFYNAEMDKAIVERMNLERALKTALERGEFLLHYQPQIDIKTGRIVGCEALIRWRHPEMGLVSPVRFIPLAEEVRLIIPIGLWVLSTACAQNMAWQNAGFPPQRISVNLSMRQFQHKTIMDDIKGVLEETGMNPRYLDLEITESGVMQSVEESIRTMKEIKELGVNLSIDDFGTGYSSLVYLKRFPIDILKIDQNFIKNCVSDAADAVITSTIISMSHNLDIMVIAEGVETVEQLELLRVFGCDEVQGYIFSRPVPAEDFTKLLEEERVFHVVE
jgi:diguanylate cyclase (GGDEF)-like protein/PAS domain S-box-containing protein